MEQRDPELINIYSRRRLIPPNEDFSHELDIWFSRFYQEENYKLMRIMDKNGYSTLSILRRAIQDNNTSAINVFLSGNILTSESKNYWREKAVLDAVAFNNQNLLKLFLPVTSLHSSDVKKIWKKYISDNDTEIIDFMIDDLENSYILNQGLEIALEAKREDLVNRMLANGAEFRQNVAGSLDPLFYAVGSGSEEIVANLLSLGHDPNFKAPYSNMDLLSLATKLEDTSILKWLLRYGANTTPEASFSAVKNQNEKALKLLLEHDTATILRQRSALLVTCAIHGTSEIADLLIQSGFDPSISDGSESPLIAATRVGNFEISETLIKGGADLAVSSNISRKQPIHYAAENKMIDTLLLMEEYGADITESYSFGYETFSALRYLVSTDLPTFQSFFAKGFSDESKQHALIEAVFKRDMEKVKFMLEKGVSINSRGTKKIIENYWVTEYSVTSGNLTTHYGRTNSDQIYHKNVTPLISACAVEDQDIVEFLLAKEPDLNLIDDHGRTALITAILTENESILELLLSAGADANLTAKEHLFPLFVAIRVEALECLKLLLQYGVNTDFTTSNGLTYQEVLTEIKDPITRRNIEDIINKSRN